MTEAIVTKFRVGGMDCANCASKVENAVSRVPGVTEVGASYTAQSMTVTHTGVPLAAIRNAVKAVGYTAAAADAAPEGDHAHDHSELGDGPWWQTKKAMLTWGCGLTLAAAYLMGQVLPDVGHWAFLAALLVGLVPIGRRA